MCNNVDNNIGSIVVLECKIDSLNLTYLQCGIVCNKNSSLVFLLFMITIICDWASENGPSGHTKFNHIFHICCNITNELVKLCKYNFHHQHTIS